MAETLIDRLRDDIASLAALHGPSGREQAIIAALAERVRPLAQSVRVDYMGNLHADCGGPSDAPLVLLDAHADEIGCLVRSIEPEGYLRIFKVGGILDSLLVGRKVSVNGLRGVIGVKAGHLQSPEEQRTVLPVKDLYVDLGLSSDHEVRQAGIAVGDPVTYVSEIEEMANPNRLCGKAIDNRAGCAVLLNAVRELVAGSLPVRLVAQFTVQEETGLHGAGPAAFNYAPHLAIAIDTVPCGDTPDVKFHSELPIALGRGPVLQAASSSSYGGMITPESVLGFAVRTAEEIGIPHQEAILEGGSTNATAIHYSRSGVPAIAVTIPRRYSHSPIEVVDLNDVTATLQLVVAMTRKAGEEGFAFLMASNLPETEAPATEPTDEELVNSRFSDPFVGEVYNWEGNLVVGEGYTEHTPQVRRTINARNLAFAISTNEGDSGPAIELGLFPTPENETPADKEKRVRAVRKRAMELVDIGELDMAIELGFLPKPKVEPEPRKVDRDGNLVSEAVAIEF